MALPLAVTTAVLPNIRRTYLVGGILLCTIHLIGQIHHTCLCWNVNIAGLTSPPEINGSLMDADKILEFTISCPLSTSLGDFSLNLYAPCVPRSSSKLLYARNTTLASPRKRSDMNKVNIRELYNRKGLFKGILLP